MFCRRRGLSLFRYYTTSTRAKLKSEPLIFKPTFSRAPTEAGKIGPLTHHKFLTLDTMASNTIEPATVVRELETVEIQVEYSKETPIETTQVAKEIQVETLNNATMTSVTTMDSDSHAGTLGLSRNWETSRLLDHLQPKKYALTRRAAKRPIRRCEGYAKPCQNIAPQRMSNGKILWHSWERTSWIRL